MSWKHRVRHFLCEINHNMLTFLSKSEQDLLYEDQVSFFVGLSARRSVRIDSEDEVKKKV